MTLLFHISPITNRKQTGKIPGSSMRVSPPTLLELDWPAADRLPGFFLRYYRVTLPVSPATQPRVSPAPAQACAGREASLNICHGRLADAVDVVNPIGTIAVLKNIRRRKALTS
ncbi:hypothetical protein RY831_24435 [Noviherbaspirillum sp. CPCC 100848]|uniref:Uncharacterized protein n=1 Tax=Noviherbaspirillum album TaxID=3080276 RepID=A0ABU6JF71_9BURK|nr:hypothetical protein [Noviherbaspirillum sp. CPCC 100848]MEC4722315.1 hypothetical protein [Noviherbaspirillum sp. CPCC 100848]